MRPEDSHRAAGDRDRRKDQGHRVEDRCGGGARARLDRGDPAAMGFLRGAATAAKEDCLGLLHVAATIAQAQAFGATVLVPLIDNGAIELAHLADPEGNRFGIWRPKPPAS